VTLAAVGDTNGYNIPLGGQDREDPLQGVRHLLDEGDVFIFNFEGVLLSQVPTPETCRKFPQQSLFYSPPQIADFLHPTQLTIALLPLKLDSFGRPEVPSPQEASLTLRDIATLSATLGTTVEIRGDIGYTMVKRQR
jgi:hypothetical protein